MRVLVVEDDPMIAAALRDGLRQEHFAVDVEYDGESAYHAIVGDSYDVIVLDILLPSMDGITLARKVREQNIHTPILMLSAKDHVTDRITGLNFGADDYMVKPFSFEELLARIGALLRRPEATLQRVLCAGQLTLDLVHGVVTRENQIIHLSSKEYAMLEYLLRHKQRIISKHDLRNHIWDFDAEILPHTVEVTLANLRAKIDKPFVQPLIVTVRGFGYTIRD